MPTSISSLCQDVLKTILLLVIASARGATDLARVVTLSRSFKEFGDDEYLLKVANFEIFSVLDVQHCYRTNGLLVKCAEAGNVGAQYVLAQVILMGFWQYKQPVFYLDKDLHDFLSHFMLEQAVISSSTKKRFSHFDLVSLFLSRSSILDHVSMLPYMKIYLNLFGYGNEGAAKFYHYYNCMNILIRVIVDVGRERMRYPYCPRFGQVEPEMRNGYDVLLDIIGSSYYYIGNDYELSALEWEELKRECLFIEKELLSSECYAEPLEELKSLHTGKRFFYYLAFDGLVTRDIALPLNYYESCLQTKCFFYAKSYYESRQMAVSAFDRMFLTGDIQVAGSSTVN